MSETGNEQNGGQACLDTVAKVLIRCFWAGAILLLVWFVFFAVASDWIYAVHSSWFTMSRQQFDVIHYCGMAITKVLVFLIFLIPYICIRIVLKKRG